MKDWTGNSKSAFSTIGASNHSKGERAEHDYYATEPKAVEILLENETFSPYVWECACGEGHMSKVLENAGYKVKSSDIIDRGYKNTEIIDFLKAQKQDIRHGFSRDIITNPPYKFAKEFVEKALEISMGGAKIAMFVKLTFLESKGRKELFLKHPPKTVYVSSSRLHCWKNGDEKACKGNAIAFIWIVWQKDFRGHPIIKWVN